MEVMAIPLDTPGVLVPPAFLEQGAPHGHRRGPRYRGHADGWDVLAFAAPALADTATIAAGGRLDDDGVLYDSPGASSAAVRGRPTTGGPINLGPGRRDGRIT